jgi:SPP1 gp7 family putative phage head morphogenesis protein
VAKATGKKAATLKRLRSFLDAEEPKAVQWLVSTWNGQGAAVTYKELREAILGGGMSQKQLEKWQKDYANLVYTKLAPQWHKAMEAAATEIKARYPYFLYDPHVGAAQEYIKQHGAQLITNLAAEQKNAVQAMIAQAAYYDGVTTDSLSRLIRPAIGLTKPQAIANLNHYNAVLATLKADHPRMTAESAEAKARDAAAKYAARQHRYRAQNIARTELAAAYNQGGYGATLDAYAQGYIGDCAKIWLTADDERVCLECGAVDGESVNMTALFSIGVLLPPAHPSCRCAVAYEEITEPLTPNAGSGTMEPQEPPQQTTAAQSVTPQTAAQAPLPLAGEPVPPAGSPKPIEYNQYSNVADVPQEYEEKLRSLPTAQQTALTGYTGASYHGINEYLRTGKPASKSAIRTIQKMDEAFMKQAAEIPENVVLFRGTRPTAFVEWDALKNIPISDWIGQTLTDKGFISTSIIEKSGFKRDMNLEIRVPKGTKGIFVKPISKFPDEDEVTLDRGTVFRIDSVTKDNDMNVYHVDVTVIDHS